MGVNFGEIRKYVKGLKLGSKGGFKLKGKHIKGVASIKGVTGGSGGVK